ARGENITVIFINNAIYGMTGGQMAPTTLLGQKSTTSQAGRSVALNGNPIKVCEMLATLDGPSYIARCSLSDTANVNKAKKAIKKAFENQIAGKGFAMVELLSSCPTNWGMTPTQAVDFVKEEMTKVFPLGVYKDIDKE
ncbi:MAG: 2-oxoglutarate oxidoreductase, partial [Clostridia bacterium]|nr:2-oxoglutarate oxidoreductase [Clostridia bacterium]